MAWILGDALRKRWDGLTRTQRCSVVAGLYDANGGLPDYGGLGPGLRRLLADHLNDDHIDEVLGIRDEYTPPSDCGDDDGDGGPEQCKNGGPHEYSSARQHVSYNASKRHAGGIHFEDDDGSISDTHGYLTKSYRCLVCGKTIREAFRYEGTGITAGPAACPPSQKETQ